MKNILTGNGINLQFAGKEYNIGSIMRRLLSRFSSDYYNGIIEGVISKHDFNKLISQIPNEFNSLLMDDSYFEIDKYIDRSAVLDVRLRYKQPVHEINDIMLEDLFLPLHVLLSNNKNIDNVKIRRIFEMMILDSIYNNGDIQKIHLVMPDMFRDFLLSFDNIFTLNYDNNLEYITKQYVYHLHGDFSTLLDEYNTNTIIGYVNTELGKSTRINPDDIHIHCNALLDYCGNNKIKNVILDWQTNALYDNIYQRYCKEPDFREEIDNLKNENLELYHYVMTKVHNPDLKFRTDYHFHKLSQEVNGEVHILGMSPNNDGHIFNLICSNENISTIVYYFFSEDDMEIICDSIYNKRCEFIPVKDFWKSIGC